MKRRPQNVLQQLLDHSSRFSRSQYLDSGLNFSCTHVFAFVSCCISADFHDLLVPRQWQPLLRRQTRVGFRRFTALLTLTFGLHHDCHSWPSQTKGLGEGKKQLRLFIIGKNVLLQACRAAQFGWNVSSYWKAHFFIVDTSMQPRFWVWILTWHNGISRLS